MRIPLCVLALAISAWGADTNSAKPADDKSADQAQATQQAPMVTQQPAPTDTTKPADPAAAPKPWKGFAVSAYADGYFTLNFNHPQSGKDQLQNFNFHDNEAGLNLAKVTIDKSDQMFGFRIDAGTGEALRWTHQTDPAPKGFQYIEQMYVIAKPNHVHGAEFDFGEFVTSAGAEVIESNANWNYSRSLLFAWAIPYYHFGFRSSVPVTKTFTAGLQVVNGWNNIWDNNSGKTIGVTTAVTKSKFTWSTNYYVGPEKTDTNEGKRNLVDTTLLLTPSPKVNFYINYDYGQDNRIGGGHDNWYGFAGAAHILLSKHFAISPRIEWFNDVTGFSTGTKQKLKEGTITGEYKYNDHLIARLEFRHDASDQPFFDRGAQPGSSKDMNTATLGIMVLIGPKK